MKNGNQSAFPTEYQDDVNGRELGLTKREYFAGLAMQGILSCNTEYLYGNGTPPSTSLVAELSMKYSDELLKQLEA